LLAHRARLEITPQSDRLLELVVAPAGAGKFTARLGDRLLCTSTKPFLDSARALLADGVDPATVLTMRHEGSATITLRATVGTAAGLTVLEGDLRPRFGRWQPFTTAATAAMKEAA
jgi:hypothetical protein